MQRWSPGPRGAEIDSVVHTVSCAQEEDLRVLTVSPLITAILSVQFERGVDMPLAALAGIFMAAGGARQHCGTQNRPCVSSVGRPSECSSPKNQKTPRVPQVRSVNLGLRVRAILVARAGKTRSSSGIWSGKV